MVLLLSCLHIEDGGGQLHVPCLCRDLGRRLATSDGHRRDDRREAHEERAVAFESGEVSHGFRIAFDRLAELGTMAVPRSLTFSRGNASAVRGGKVPAGAHNPSYHRFDSWPRYLLTPAL